MYERDGIRPNCSCEPLGCNLLEPGNGNPQGYPTIGTVVANNAVNFNTSNSYISGSIASAIYTGTPPSGPPGPFYSGITQNGFGNKIGWTAQGKLTCQTALASLPSLTATMLKGIIKYAAKFPLEVVTSATNVAATGAEVTIVGVGETLAAFAAVLAAPELALVFTFAGVTFAAYAIDIYCLNGPS